MSRLWTGFRSVFADGIQAFLAYKTVWNDRLAIVSSS